MVNLPGVKADLVYEWPDATMRGIACVHYATGLLGKDVAPDGDHPLLRWMGGYFANRSCPPHGSFAGILPDAVITHAAPQQSCLAWFAGLHRA